MGMYTELHFNAELRKDTPEDVIDILRKMVDGDPSNEYQHEQSHELFSKDRFRWMLHSDSYYFPAKSHSMLFYDNIGGNCYLCIRCNLKNYEGEIEAFLDWIEPFVEAIPGSFLGFYRYEETEEPTLVYHKAPPHTVSLPPGHLGRFQ